MKKLFILGIILVSFQGCAAMGKILQGAGHGLQDASREPAESQNIQQPTHCQSMVFANSVQTNCY